MTGRRTHYKPCPVCGEPVPCHKNRVTCSFRCRGVRLRQRYQGRDMSAVVAAGHRARQRKLAARLSDQFGPLTEREVALVRVALRLGYNQRQGHERYQFQAALRRLHTGGGSVWTGSHL